MEHFNFKKKKAVNPLEKVNDFFINPYMMESAKALGLEDKAKQNEIRTIAFYKGMPVVIFPLDMLDLGTCLVKWQDNGGIILYKGKFGEINIYFKWTDEPDCIRIDTVLVKNQVSDRDLIELLKASF